VISALIGARSSAALAEKAVAKATRTISGRRLKVLMRISLTEVTKDHKENFGLL
jgi:hypothetical protein